MSQTAVVTMSPRERASRPIELSNLHLPQQDDTTGNKADGRLSASAAAVEGAAEQGGHLYERPPDDEDAPLDAQAEAERWNRPGKNVGRMAFAFWGFMIAGMNDAAVGPLLPYLEDYYDLGKTVVSLIFLTPFFGYSVAAFTNARIHVRFGQRGVAIMAPLCHILTYVVLAVHPPYPVLVVCNAVSGFGNGLLDACFCAWVGSMDKANAIQGFLHACYSLGALFSPLVATSMVAKAELPWYTFYYIMIGVSVVELLGLCLFFWDKSGQVHRAQHAREDASPASASVPTSGAGTRDALQSRVTWLCALFFFAYMGVEVGLGGWVTTFMLNVRHASAYASGIANTGFWAGMAVGRASLGFVTERYGERICLTVYLAACLGLQLLFWLVPRFVVSAVAVALLGFFLGPMFPGAVMITAKLLPKRIHVSAIGFAMAMGGTGGAVFPFIIGAVASNKGVAVLQPIILALIAVVAGVWLSFPRIQKRE